MSFKRLSSTLLRRYEQHIGRSLLGSTLLVTFTSLLIGGVFIAIAILMHAEYHAKKMANQQLNELIESMAPMVSIACFTDDATLATETAQAFVKQSMVARIKIRKGDRMLADVRRNDNARSPSSTPISRRVFSPFVPDETIGEMQVTPNQEAIDAQVEASLKSTLTSAIAIVGLAFAAMGLAVTTFVIRPVKQISDKLHTLNAAAGELLSMPASRAHQKNELGRLVEDVNQLILRFREALEVEHRVNLEQVVAEKMLLAAEVFDHTQEGIIITNADNRIVSVNRAFTLITGFSEQDVMGQNPNILASGRHDQAFYRQMWRELIETGHWKGELWNRCKDGSVKPKWISITAIYDEAGRVTQYIGLFSDISERKEAEERIEFLAHHDALTSLPNRILTRDRFDQALALAKRQKTGMAMLFVDLDHFKYVNDTFGHIAGDDLLIESVKRLEKTVRESDTISRQGGDEFLIILPAINDNLAISRIAQHMLDTLSLPFTISGHSLGISASIGIALYPKHGEDFDTLLKNADAAMYGAKAAGKNTYRFFTDELNIDARDKLQLKAYLRTALDHGEFRLHLQPQVDLATGRAIGVESLLRWRHPELGFISPARFIPVAEESGLINPIGEWVIQEACRLGAARLATGGMPLLIAVNISAQQFSRSNLMDVVATALARTGFPAHQLELEFTESGLLTDIDHSIETIRQLKELGVKTAIDDFGTGYSSLSYLKQFRVEKLKIDQSFVRDLESDSEDLEIVRAIIQLGKTLNLRVIAEGVETTAQIAMLAELGCDEVQGYLIAKPLPTEDVEAWLEAWPARVHQLLSANALQARYL